MGTSTLKISDTAVVDTGTLRNVNQGCVVNFLDMGPRIAILSGNERLTFE